MAGKLYWTKERCTKVALLYETRKSFQASEHSGAYVSSIRNGWIDEVCQHMRVIQGQWTKEACHNEALKYSAAGAFRKGSGSAFTMSYRNGWYHEITQHFVKDYASGERSGAFIWSRKKVKAEAKKYDNRSEFRRHVPGAANAADKYGILEAVCAHMIPGDRGFRKDKPAILYYIAVRGLYKIGITNRTVKQRLKQDYDDVRVLARKRFKIGAQAAKAERAILDFVDKQYRYTGKPVLHSGNTELFTRDILSLDTENHND